MEQKDDESDELSLEHVEDILRNIDIRLKELEIKTGLKTLS